MVHDEGERGSHEAIQQSTDALERRAKELATTLQEEMARLEGLTDDEVLLRKELIGKISVHVRSLITELKEIEGQAMELGLTTFRRGLVMTCLTIGAYFADRAGGGGGVMPLMIGGGMAAALVSLGTLVVFLNRRAKRAGIKTELEELERELLGQKKT